MTHGSLFSGIGGFDLAAEWAGIKNIFQVEIDEFCQKVLQKNFPQTKKYKDIKEFNGKEYEGKINIISGGFPCQPFSIAGKRKGIDDDRHLFPEMLRVISEIKPDWVIAENVYGLLNIQDGMVFEQVCIELENLNYEVQAFIIPACGKNAPHKRDRLWIIANSGCKYGQRKQDKGKFNREIHSEKTTTLSERPISNDRERTSPNPERGELGRVRDEGKEKGAYTSNELFGEQFGLSWLQVATRFCRMDDGVSEELYKLKTSDRAARLKALGNAIVPQVAYEIFKEIKEFG